MFSASILIIYSMLIEFKQNLQVISYYKYEIA